MYKIKADTGQHGDLACEQCRRRKSKCDRTRPRCGCCLRTGTDCIFLDKRPKRGPKKGQLQALRAKIASLEQQLAEQANVEPPGSSQNSEPCELDLDSNIHAVDLRGDPVFDASGEMNAVTSSWLDGLAGDWVHANLEFQDEGPECERPECEAPASSLDCFDLSDIVKAELDTLYFDRVHPFAPFLNRESYLSWGNQEAPGPARICLRLAMWTLAAAMSAQFETHTDRLYEAASLALTQLHGGLDLDLPWVARHVELEEAQGWLLLAYYNFVRSKRRHVQASAARALRLVQLAGLHRVDALPLECTRCGSPAPDPGNVIDAEFEERRTTFWVAFCLDRLFSAYSSLALTIQEEVVNVQLPETKTGADTHQRPYGNLIAHAIMSRQQEGGSKASPFAESVALAALYGHCLTHRRLAMALVADGGAVEPKDVDEFYRRHEWLAQALEAHTRPLPDVPFDAECNPFIAFNYAMARGAVIHLYETASSWQWQVERQKAMLRAAENSALQAALGIVLLTRRLHRISYLKAHPFLPCILAHAAVFLRRYGDGDKKELCNSEGEEGEGRLVACLKRFETNNAAKDLVEKLERGAKHLF